MNFREGNARVAPSDVPLRDSQAALQAQKLGQKDFQLHAFRRRERFRGAAEADDAGERRFGLAVGKLGFGNERRRDNDRFAATDLCHVAQAALAQSLRAAGVETFVVNGATPAAARASA